MPSCPLCGREWEPLDELRIVNGMVFWKGEHVLFRAEGTNPVSRGAPSKLLALLLENLGKPIPYHHVYDHLYGGRVDGGPTLETFRVQLSRVRRLLRDNSIPLHVVTHNAEIDLPFSGTLTLMRK